MTCDIMPSFYRHSEPVARKQYHCVECSAPILKGEKHFACTGSWEDDLQSHRQHLDCLEACMLIRDEFEAGECIPFGGLFEWLDERHTELHWCKGRTGKHADNWRKLRSLVAKIKWRERAAQAAKGT